MPKKKSKQEEPKGSNSETANTRVVDISISDEMKESFIAYSMSVITMRALPDVRDGLKPVHRRILYSLHGLGLSHSAKFKKSAFIVGDVLGKYHPHGDTAVYDAMVNMAQDFSFRYPFVIGQGNFGSLDGDGAAAMRYTEAKMSKIAGELLRDIQKDTVDLVPNYDASLKEPAVLPAAVPAVLLNGTLGIAVGMATNIPPHNLGEIIDATVALMDDPEATNEEMMKYIKGPDFPTGGVAYGKKDIAHASSTGRGGVVVRGEAEIVDRKGGGHSIIITSIPYRVNKENLIIKIADLKMEKKIEGLKGLRDESTDDVRIVIDLSASANPQRVLNYIYKKTELESTFHYNLVALVDGTPQTLSVRDILGHFIDHRKDVIRRRTLFDLSKAEARAHILEGLKKALDKIDAVIKTIKASKDTPTARTNLMKKFKFSEIQAQAILDMKLQKLAGLERKKIEDELKEVMALIKYLSSLLKSTKKMLGVIRDELLEIRETYADERRTRIAAQAVGSISDEDLIPQKESALVFTAGGYIKRTDPGEFKKQKRGGVGVVDLNTKEEDVVTHLLTTNTHSYLLFFTDFGKVYRLKMYDLPEGKRATRGKSIKNYLPLADGEQVTSILPLPKETDAQNSAVLLVTDQGVVKKVALDDFKNVRANGIIAIKLSKSDRLLGARILAKGDHVVLITKSGQSIRFLESDARAMGRSAAGVRGIKLGSKDAVVGLGVVRTGNEEPSLLIMTENGYGKRTDIKEYKVQKRGGSGIKTANITAKTGALVAAKVVAPSNVELIAISKKSQVIRTEVGSVSMLGRATQGVRIMKLRAGDGIASLTLL